jgi:hypothetical protein
MFGFFGKPSRSKFAKIIMDAARKAGVGGELKFDEKEFVIHYGSGRFFLGNFYDEYCAGNRARKADLVQGAISMMMQGDHAVSREEALEQVVAVVRERAMFGFLALRQQIDGGEAIAPVMEPLSDWYVRTLVIDAPRFMQMVTQKDLKDWDVSAEELFEIGLKRLRDASTPKFQPEDGFFVGAWDDDYDSSRILVPEVFEDLPFEGEPVFCLPNRRMLFVADSANTAAVLAMLNKAEELVQNAPRPQNPVPLTYRDGEVTDFHPAPGSELYDAVRRARGVTGILYYEEQAEMLGALHEKTGKDIFIAKFTLTKRDDGSFMSYSVWPRDVPTLLPKTDLVMCHDPQKPEEEQTVPVKWEDLGDLLLDAEMFPPRYYVSKFPPGDRIEKMRVGGI